MVYDESKSELRNLFNAVNENTEKVKETNQRLKDLYALFNHLSSEEYFNEVVAKDGIIPK